MLRSLFTGLTGLRSSQLGMDTTLRLMPLSARIPAASSARWTSDPVVMMSSSGESEVCHNE